MGAVHDQLAEAFREHRDAFGVSVTFGTTPVQAVASMADLSREWVGGGYREEGEEAVHVLLADLPAVPALQSLATYKEIPWTVEAVDIQPGGLVGKFTLKPYRR